jgi:hypothetical protein
VDLAASSGALETSPALLFAQHTRSAALQGFIQLLEDRKERLVKLCKTFGHVVHDLLKRDAARNAGDDSAAGVRLQEFLSQEELEGSDEEGEMPDGQSRAGGSPAEEAVDDPLLGFF